MCLLALQAIVTVLIAAEFRRSVHTSGFLSCYWLVYLIYSAVPIYSYIMLPHHSVIHIYIIFTARRYASAVVSVVLCLCVRLSVRLSQADIVSKRLQIGSRKQRPVSYTHLTLPTNREV